MPLPVPNLDDRTFDQLVTEARALIPQELPCLDRLQSLRPGDNAARALRVPD